MSEERTFNQKVILATSEMEQHLDSKDLAKMQENYRLVLACISNLFEALAKRGLITPDPYKDVSKVTEIVCPPTKPFTDNDRPTELGIRLGQFEVMIDYVCNYMKFNCKQLTSDKLRKLYELNHVFDWNAFSQNSAKSNTRAFAAVLNELKKGAPQLTLSLIKDSVLKTQNAMAENDSTIQRLMEFQKERYKIEVRKNILENEAFNKSTLSSGPALVAEIKRMFPSAMGKKAYNSDLINEIVNEETADNKAELQNALLAKISVAQEKQEESKNTINTHDVIVEALRTLGTSCDQFKVVLDKIVSNHDVLLSEHNSFGDKLKKFLRNLFGLAEPPVDYVIFIQDKRTGEKKKETVHYVEFVQLLAKKIKLYANFSQRGTPGFAKMNSQNDTVILDYLNKQSTENNHLFAQITALDEYFKSTVTQANRSKIRGCSMELISIKNVVVKANQLRSEYVSYVEEAEQMRKLGIE